MPYQFSGPDSSSLPPHTFVTSHVPCLSPCLSLQHLDFNGHVGEHDEPGKWLIDSGASSHYSPFRHLFSFLSPIPPIQILTGNGFIHAFFKGTIPLLVRTGDNSAVRIILLENVLFVPMLQSRVNLFSIVVLANKGISSNFGPDAVHFSSRDGTLLARGTRIGASWWLDADTRSNSLCLALTQHHPQPESVWHQRLGHLHLRGIHDLLKASTGIVIGTPPIPTTITCVGCLVGKQHRNISRIQRSLPNRRLSCIHIDISGPMQTPGYVGKHLYLAVLVDEATRWTTSYCLVKKDDIRNYFFEFVINTERYTGDRVLAIFSDNEGALLFNDFQLWLRQNGIQHYTTQTYSPEMNGIAEATIKHVITRASAMLWTSQVPLGFWPEAVRCATYLKNRTVATHTHGKTPFEAFHGVPPNLGHLRIFGCRCYAHVENENRQKFDPHTAECIFLGYYETESLYAVYDVNRRTIMKKRDVVFYEHILGHPLLANLGLAIGFNILGAPVSDETSPPELDCSTSVPNIPVTPAVANPVTPAVANPVAPAVTNPVPPSVPIVNSTALIATLPSEPDIWVQDITGGKTYTLNQEIWRQYLLQHPSASPVPDTDSVLDRYTSYFHSLLSKLDIPTQFPPALSSAVPEDDPTSWSAILSSPNRAFWLHAAFDEICQIVRMRTFDFVPLSSIPSGRSPLPSKWVWKSKRDLHNNIEKFKARWVVRGDKQIKDIDYTETFAPVAKLSTIRILFTIVASLDLELDHLDVVSAFLNGDIDTTVYLKQPQGFIIDSSSCCRLNKSLYGLCQAARSWYTKLNETLQGVQYHRLWSDMAVWILKPCSGSELHFIAAHVDDMVCGGSPAAIQHTKDYLRRQFQIRDLGPASVFIGLRITRDRENRRLYIDQNHYARDILDLYGMSKCNPCLVPITPDTPLAKALPSEKLPPEQTRLYQAMIGSLGYLMNCSRPDLAFSVNRLAQFASCPAERHMLAVKRVLRYLRHTTEARLSLGPTSVSDPTPSESPTVSTNHLDSLRVQGWFDASWADDPEDRRSTFGYALTYGSTTLVWKSKKHRATTLSTTDAEYVAATELTRELSFIRNIFEELGIPFVMPVHLYGDNVNANNLANSM